MPNAIQGTFGQAAAPTPLLRVTLPNPTTAGSLLVVSVRFSSPGSPTVVDSFGNAPVLAFAVAVNGTTGFGLWAFDLPRAGTGHAVTVVPPVPATLEVSAVELLPGGGNTVKGLLGGILGKLTQQTDLIQRLVTAERA